MEARSDLDSLVWWGFGLSYICMHADYLLFKNAVRFFWIWDYSLIINHLTQTLTYFLIRTSYFFVIVFAVFPIGSVGIMYLSLVYGGTNEENTIGNTSEVSKM